MSNKKNTGPCPSFFRASIYEARTSSYSHAGYALASALRTEAPWDLDADFDEIVVAALREPDPPTAIWNVIRQHLPRCADLVPARRRVTFVRGIKQAIEEERV